MRVRVLLSVIPVQAGKINLSLAVAVNAAKNFPNRTQTKQLANVQQV